MSTQTALDFDGPAYRPEHDRERLTGQLRRIVDVMKDGEWRTLEEIREATGAPEASVSAQLRHLRKARFGKHTVLKRRRGDPKQGTWEMKLILNQPLGGTP